MMSPDEGARFPEAFVRRFRIVERLSISSKRITGFLVLDFCKACIKDPGIAPT